MATLDVSQYARLWRGVAAADAIDIAGALAVVVRSEGFVVIRSRAAHESDYEAALRVATFLMGQGDPNFRSRL